MNEQIIEQSEALKPNFKGKQNKALILGVGGIALGVIGYFTQSEQFFRSYLLAYIYWLSLSLGCLVILMIHHLAGGRWGFSIRRMLEAGTRTFGLMFILFLPILLGLHDLYSWTHAEAANDFFLSQKLPYLNVPFFIARALFYFIVWGLLSYLLNKWSSQQDQTTDTNPTHKLVNLSGPGVVAFALTATFAAVDWIMSLEPHWYSTMFAVIYMVGAALLTWAFIILVAVPLSNKEPLNQLLTNERLRDLGTFMLACVMLWAYTSFSQLLIIWGGNLPEEITWYMTRLHGGWLILGIALVAFHFLVPFVLLISSQIKKRIPILVTVAAGLMLMRFLDLFWITAPAFREHGEFHAPLSFHWLDIVLLIGIGGLWVAYFFFQLQKRPIIAMNDPRFEHLLGQEDAHNHG